MARIEIWDRPVSHWHIKMWPKGNLVCQTFSPNHARSITAKIAPATFQSLLIARSELGEIKHAPETYQNEVVVIYVVQDSGQQDLILSDFDAQPAAKQIINSILDRVIGQTEGMTGLVQLAERL